MGAYVSYAMVLRKKRYSYENESMKRVVNLGVVKVPSRLLAEANLGAAKRS